jgi:hypothetical protein
MHDRTRAALQLENQPLSWEHAKLSFYMSLFHLTARYCNRSQNLFGNNCDRCKFVIRSSFMSPMSKRELFVQQSILKSDIFRRSTLASTSYSNCPILAVAPGKMSCSLPGAVNTSFGDKPLDCSRPGLRVTMM